MTVHQQEQPSPYRCALETARALGRADGRLEAGLGVDPGRAPVGPWCHGLDPERFAALVWGTAGGDAPAGVVLNASLWYAQGFREAAAPARDGRSRAPAWRAVPRPRSEPT